MIKSYSNFGFPPLNKVNKVKNELIKLIDQNICTNWRLLVKKAYESYGHPASFWSSTRRLLGGKGHSPPLYLQPSGDTIQSCGLTCAPNSKFISPNEQGELISQCWGTIFKPNNGNQFQNNNINKTNNWYRTNKGKYKPIKVIRYSNLIPNHPLLREITINEIINCIKSFKDKSPGPSGIKFSQIKILPINYIQIFFHIYNSIICTGHYPDFFGHCNTIFIGKPNKSPLDPLNYRPISLLEPLAKVFGKIIS